MYTTTENEERALRVNSGRVLFAPFMLCDFWLAALFGSSAWADVSLVASSPTLLLSFNYQQLSAGVEAGGVLTSRSSSRVGVGARLVTGRSDSAPRDRDGRGGNLDFDRALQGRAQRGHSFNDPES